MIKLFAHNLAKLDQKPLKTLYPHQKQGLRTILSKFESSDTPMRLIYQLPTGGGKTLMFSELVKDYLRKYDHQVIVLTHRLELCSQTAQTLKGLGVKNMLIDSSVKADCNVAKYPCLVAMVETLNHRIEDGLIDPRKIGLVIIDEAHHNSFQKLLSKFESAHILGVTATPLSADSATPLHQDYQELLIGASIETLIAEGYLAKPKTYCYDVDLSLLETGMQGDYSVNTSDALYTSEAMLRLLLDSCTSHCKQKKTLIFNNGVFTSKTVTAFLTEQGFNVKHLDHHTPLAERESTLRWFKKTKGAILSSVSLLTTGFDEPSIQCVVINRATTSLTLYHQMIGRGSRPLSNKKTFKIIDLGNHSMRFGPWEKSLDWQGIFDDPESYIASSHPVSTHLIPTQVKSHFPNTLVFKMDVFEAFHEADEQGIPVKSVIDKSIVQHGAMCLENSKNVAEALSLIEHLDNEIKWRVKQYGKCLGKATKNYLDWLQDDYRKKLKQYIIQQKTSLEAEVSNTGLSA